MYVRDFLQTVTVYDTYTDDTRSCRRTESQRYRFVNHSPFQYVFAYSSKDYALLAENVCFFATHDYS